RSQIHFKVLGKFARGVGDQVANEFCLSPTEGWTIGKDNSVIGGFIEIMYFGARGELGSLLSID
ncbi:hypothetical protein A2U01_0089920, partial [Trifolium medium]|nr:hypothetical protein [Trifolium medium]